MSQQAPLRTYTAPASCCTLHARFEVISSFPTPATQLVRVFFLISHAQIHEQERADYRTFVENPPVKQHKATRSAFVIAWNHTHRTGKWRFYYNLTTTTSSLKLASKHFFTFDQHSLAWPGHSRPHSASDAGGPPLKGNGSP